MKTRMTRSPAVAAAALVAGGVAAFPTETVYGLGANVFDEEAVRAIFRAKGRPADNPLIVHVAKFSQIGRVAARVTRSAQRLLEAFGPAPLTVVLPAHRLLPRVVTGGLDTVGVRIPDHQLALEFLRACGFPVAAPSANRSGRPSPTTWRAVRTDLEGRIPCILQGPPARHGVESTVVDCTGRTPLLLRAGAIPLERLREILPRIRVPLPDDTTRHRSPGQKYRHYAPRARVRVVDEGEVLPVRTEAFIGLRAPAGCPRRRKICPDPASYARELFHYFRLCDEAGIRHIACQAIPEEGIGLALMDRLRRAERR